MLALRLLLRAPRRQQSWPICAVWFTNCETRLRHFIGPRPRVACWSLLHPLALLLAMLVLLALLVLLPPLLQYPAIRLLLHPALWLLLLLLQLALLLVVPLEQRVAGHRLLLPPLPQHPTLRLLLHPSLWLLLLQLALLSVVPMEQRVAVPYSVADLGPGRGIGALGRSQYGCEATATLAPP